MRLVGEPRVLEVGRRGGDLRPRRTPASTPPGRSDRSSAARWNRRDASDSRTCEDSPCDVLRVVGGVGPELVRRNHGNPLILLDQVAFVHQQLRDLAADLRADDHVVGRDDAGEHERGGRRVEVGVERGTAADEQDEDDDPAYAFHGGEFGTLGRVSNSCIKHLFESSQAFPGRRPTSRAASMAEWTAMSGRGRLLAGCCLVICLRAAASAANPQEVAPRAREVYARALALEAKGNDAAALPLLWQAAALAPDDADVQQRLGEALLRLGVLDAAIDAFRHALSARPDFQKAANSLILGLVQAGRGPDAMDEARRFIAAAPGDPDRYFTLGLAQSDQDVGGAIATFRRVLTLAPGHVLARYNLALVLQRADRQTEAADELRRAIAIDPRPEAYYTLGVIAWHQGDLDRAVSALGEAIAAEPNTPRPTTRSGPC